MSNLKIKVKKEHRVYGEISVPSASSLCTLCSLLLGAIFIHDYAPQEHGH